MLCLLSVCQGGKAPLLFFTHLLESRVPERKKFLSIRHVNIDVEGGSGVDAVSCDAWIGSSHKLWNFCKRFQTCGLLGFKNSKSRDTLQIPHQIPESACGACSAALRSPRHLGGSDHARPRNAKLIGAPIAGSLVSSPPSTRGAQANACLQRQYSERLEQVAASDKV